MIDQWEAMLVAAPWVNQDARPGATPGIGVSEFDLGFVLWRIPPAGEPAPEGAGRVVVDRRSGELTHWPSVPAETVAELYRDFRRETPVSPLTWDPLTQARHERLRAAFPTQVTHLRLRDGRLRIARSMKGDGTPNLHPLVAEALGRLPIEDRVRGGERCSEVAALSDLLHVEDARRAAGEQPSLTIDAVREELLRGSDIVTFQVREPADPLGGQSRPPCRSCQALLRGFGFAAAGGGDL